MNTNQHIENCWILVSHDLASGTNSINFCSEDTVAFNIKRFGASSSEIPIYFRQFNNILDALAHKLLLENLGRESMKAIIKRMNPEGKNLLSEFITLTTACCCED